MESLPHLGEEVWRTTIAVEPRGAGRPRFSKTGHTYTPSTTREYVKLIREHAIDHFHDAPRLCALNVLIVASFSRPKSGKNKKASFHTRRPDVDNVAKAVLDALSPLEIRGHTVFGGVWLDDSQIVSLHTVKRWCDVDQTPNISISVWTL